MSFPFPPVRETLLLPFTVARLQFPALNHYFTTYFTTLTTLLLPTSNYILHLLPYSPPPSPFCNALNFAATYIYVHSQFSTLHCSVFFLKQLLNPTAEPCSTALDWIGLNCVYFDFWVHLLLLFTAKFCTVGKKSVPWSAWWPCKPQLWAYPRIFRGNPVREGGILPNKQKGKLQKEFNRVQIIWYFDLKLGYLCSWSTP